MWRTAQSNHWALCPDFKFIQPGRWLLLTLQSATNDLTTVCVCVFAKSVPVYTWEFLWILNNYRKTHQTHQGNCQRVWQRWEHEWMEMLFVKVAKKLTKSHPIFQDIGKLLPFKLLLSLVVHTVHLSFSFFSWQQSLSSSMTTKGRLMATDAKTDLKCFLLALGKMDTQDFRVKTLAIWAAFKHCNAPQRPQWREQFFSKTDRLILNLSHRCGENACRRVRRQIDMYACLCWCASALLTHGSSHTPPSCLANTRILCVSLSVLTLRVVELQTRSIFSLPCNMEVRGGGGGWEEESRSPEKRAALHRPLTLNVWGGCRECDQGVFCWPRLEGPCPSASRGPWAPSMCERSAASVSEMHREGQIGSLQRTAEFVHRQPTEKIPHQRPYVISCFR